MAQVDLQTLLERLSMGQGDERDMQLIALEQLCMLLLMSDNVDRCFESCPPRTFLPALCRIFLDECAPENVLEVTARAITYYLDVSAECTRRIVAMEGAVKAICNRLVVAELASRTSKDLAEQCVKVLELICTREAGAVFEAGGLNCILPFIRDNGSRVHKDTLHSAMAVVSRLCTKMEPQDAQLPQCVESLSTLLRHEDSHVADGALRCFATIANSMSGTKYEAMIDENVLKKMYIFSEEFFDSFTSNLITYFYVLRQIKNNAKQTKEFTISGRSLSTASNAFINASVELGKLVNDLQILKKEKPLQMADLENWTVRVYSRTSPLKKTLLETALDIFQSYEMLFMNNATDQEISKYADEAAKKILKHFVSPGEKSVADRATLTNMITRFKNSNRTIIQCCLGSLLTELLRISPDQKKNSAEKYFSSVGIWHCGQVYVTDKSKPKKYFYRRLFTTENNVIPNGYHRSDSNLQMYNYLLDPKDLDNVLVRLEKHFNERDITESKIKEWIGSIKCRISDERRAISMSYRLDVLEDLTDAMDHIERIAEKEDKEEDEEEKAASVPSGGVKITNVKSTKITNWNSVF